MSFLKRFFGDSKSENAQEPLIACPNCGVILEVRPKRKKKCPHCDQYIFVRKGKLLTENEMKIEKWLDRLEEFGISREDYDRHHQQVSEQFGLEAEVNDTVWRILNWLVGQVSASQLPSVYLEMARLVAEEGRNTKPYLIEANKAQLANYKRQGIQSVKILTCNDGYVCSACRALHEQELALDEALSKMLIPTVCENASGCRCWYVAQS